MKSFKLKNCSELTDEDRKELSAWFYIDFWGILFYRDNQWREIRINIPKEEWSKNREDIFWETETIRNTLYLKRKKWENLLLPSPIFLPKNEIKKKKWSNKIEIDSKTLIKVIAYNVLLLINQDEEEEVKNLNFNELFEYLREIKWEVTLLLENK